MKNYFKLGMTLLPFGLFASQAFAVGAVPESAANKIRLGESSADVIQALGQPRSMPKWMNGDKSLVYTVVNGSESSNEALYVDVDSSGKVVDTVVLNNSDDQ